ncbi:MAG TPA: OmpA family protein [Burkholderiales bacterium]|nr:OmpA family protein [Burkholderiales bacterium]
MTKTINKSKPALLLSAAALALSAVAAPASAANLPDIWKNSNGLVWKNAYGQCWRTTYTTPADATQECDPDLVPKPAPPAPAAAPAAPAPAPAPAPAAPAPRPAPAGVAPVTEKVSLSADVLFDFDKSVVKPEGKAKLDDLVSKLKAVNLEVIIAIGHTDSIGSKAYNQKLSVRRAEAVKAYLISKGIAANRIYTEGKGETQPVASNKTKDGRSKNRRVEVEVVGTRNKS